MHISTVKRKVPVLTPLIFLSGTTALLSWTKLIPSNWVENIYARRVFPTISHIAGLFADTVPFSWLDIWIIGTAILLAISLIRRNWRVPVGLVCGAYLMFFWGWGLNYHRSPMEARLRLEGIPRPSREALIRLTIDTAASLNRLWPLAAERGIRSENSVYISHTATDRVRRVIDRIDGTDWRAASRIKHTYLADWWLRIAGIEGVFNPFGHEPILAGGILDFQLPFLTAHELAHVHGIADEGDANFVAFLATSQSEDPGFQYSAAFELWLNLDRTDSISLDPGPRRDLQAYFSRLRSQEIPQATRLQSAILDSHLKANGIHAGVESYSTFVALAIATRSRWPEFQ